MFKLVWPFKFTLAKSLSFKIKFGKVLKYFQDLLENISNHFLKHFPKFEVTLGNFCIHFFLIGNIFFSLLYLFLFFFIYLQTVFVCFNSCVLTCTWDWIKWENNME